MIEKEMRIDFCNTTVEVFEEAFRLGAVTVAIIGIGRIGLTLACHFSRAGAVVLGVDINPNVVSQVDRGKSPFIEIESEELLRDSFASGRLKATTHLSEALTRANVIIISVPTPVDSNYQPDLSYVKQVAALVGKQLTKGTLIIVSSTLFVTATRSLILPILETNSGLEGGRDFLLSYVPMRIDPGNHVHRLDNTPLNVGGIDEKSAEMAEALFRRIVNAEIRRVSVEIAESAKLVENTYRDLNIAFMNELAVFFERHGIDILEVIEACSTKWSFMPHYPGAGVGGNCIPVAPHYLLFEASPSELRLARLAREINSSMPEHIVDMIVEDLSQLNKTMKESKIAIMGLAYKKDIQDVRGSPAEDIITRLKDKFAEVVVHDPLLPVSATVFGCTNLPFREAAKDADCLVFVTDHTKFKDLDSRELKSLVHNPCLLVDGRNIFKPFDVVKNGFHYRGVGRSKVS